MRVLGFEGGAPERAGESIHSSIATWAAISAAPGNAGIVAQL
jgi:hypothetical protein